ncbi:SIK kinase 3 [Tritrichomonas musculus]|uniref:SIK kinase 3 n=1 Tax=Tritrichomonas musculus TaxID=1915356 RepID=A0ABR2KB53_9EUKA
MKKFDMCNPYPNLPHQVRNYVLNSIIGQGASSIVYRATNILYNIEFAVKVVFKSKTADINALTYEAEVNALITLDHPNVIRIYDFFNEENNLFLVLEFCGGGTLEDKISKNEELSENERIKICEQIISALKYCYDKSIAHRDIKAANVLFDNNGRIKVADFGFSGILEHDENVNEHMGTLSYSAPEVCQLKKEFNPFKSDIWSLGVLFYRLFTYSYPFEGKTNEKLKNSIVNGNYQEKLSGKIRKVVKMMLVVDPEKRISIEKLSKINLSMNQESLTPTKFTRTAPKNLLNIKLSKRRSSLIYNQNIFDKVSKPHHRRVSNFPAMSTFTEFP